MVFACSTGCTRKGASDHSGSGRAVIVGADPEEGIAHLERGLRLSPQDPGKNYYLNCIAMGHFAAGRYAEAVQWEQQSLQWNPLERTVARARAEGGL
jgi:hypothetical protein